MPLDDASQERLAVLRNRVEPADAARIDALIADADEHGIETMLSLPLGTVHPVIADAVVDAARTGEPAPGYCGVFAAVVAAFAEQLDDTDPVQCAALVRFVRDLDALVCALETQLGCAVGEA